MTSADDGSLPAEGTRERAIADLADYLNGEWPACFSDGFQQAVASAVFEHLGSQIQFPAPGTGAGPAPVPDGVYCRVEMPGWRQHEGWVTQESVFGTQAARVRDRDGRVIADVFPGPGCRILPLPVPAEVPAPGRALAITSRPDDDEQDYYDIDDSGDDDDDDGAF